jgi:Spy/CpxP family protein refolding chaperone
LKHTPLSDLDISPFRQIVKNIFRAARDSLCPQVLVYGNDFKLGNLVDAMKRTLLTTGFIVSLALNLGVGAAIGWELWLRHSFRAGKPGPELSLSPEELTLVKARFSADRQMKRQQMLQKRAELLDLVTRHTQDTSPCQQTLDEYLALSSEMDRERFASISQVMAGLSTEKRQILLLHLKERISRAKARGPGWSTQGASGYGWTSPAHQLRRSNDSPARE